MKHFLSVSQSYAKLCIFTGKHPGLVVSVEDSRSDPRFLDVGLNLGIQSWVKPHQKRALKLLILLVNRQVLISYFEAGITKNNVLVQCPS